MDSETSRTFILVPLGLVLGGLLFAIVGSVWIARERAFTRDALSAPGTVVGFWTRRLRRRRTSGGLSRTVLNFPIVRYTTRRSEPIEFESPMGSRPRIYREGQAVTVLYTPDAPERARIASGCLQYGTPIFFIALGLGLIAFSALFGLASWFFIFQLPTARRMRLAG